MSRTVWALIAATVVVSAASSSGCGQRAPFGINELTSQWLTNNDANRTYLVNLPATYDSSTAAPLILSFHGNGGTAETQSEIDDFTNKTYNSDTIVVYPQGLNNAWQVAPYASGHINDLDFITDLLDDLSSTFCVELDRVYCSGKSIGGGFCNMLACNSTLSASFAAIAPVSGAFYNTPGNESFSTNCEPSHLMPILEFHGTDDSVIPYDGGVHNGIDLPSITDWARDWAEADGCSSSTSPTSTHFNNSKVLWASYSCNGSDGVVQHYAIDNLGHVWPSLDSNYDNDGHGSYIEASPIILDFFANWTLEDTAGTTGSVVSSTPSSTKGAASSTGKASGTATSASSTGAAAMITVFPGLVGAIAFGAILL